VLGCLKNNLFGLLRVFCFLGVHVAMPHCMQIGELQSGAYRIPFEHMIRFSSTTNEGLVTSIIKLILQNDFFHKKTSIKRMAFASQGNMNPVVRNDNLKEE